MSAHLNLRSHRLARFAWGALGYTIFVILWGGFVRASGSGAGCGDSWPFCNGEIIPTNPALNTLIEFGHRVTSGLALPLVIVLAVWAFRAFERGSPARKAAVASVVFMVLEAAIGAGLVLFEYVEYNPSLARAVWMAAHLVNTLFLVAALALTAWWAGGHPPPRWSVSRSSIASTVAIVGMIVLGAGGAVTALGDTLVLSGGLSEEHPVVATLLWARIFHPTMAFVVLALVLAAVWVGRNASPLANQLGLWTVGLYLIQLALGGLNVWLQAPIWMQMVHLLMTDAIWIALVLFVSEALSVRQLDSVPTPRLART
ncbi:MAG: COX15/CtaA family protein [Rubricoccaceae bacterium]